jgi:uncharacterized protein with von Willebrand factor type A (vWA) domain
MEQLGQHLRGMFPQQGWNQSYDFQGQDPLGMGQAMQTMQELGDLDQLENLLRNASNPGALAEADMDRVRDLLGDDAARSLERLAELTRMLTEAGLIEQKEGRLELTPKGLRKIGSNALRDLFDKLAKDKVGQHQVDRFGQGHERTYETKQYGVVNVVDAVATHDDGATSVFLVNRGREEAEVTIDIRALGAVAVLEAKTLSDGDIYASNTLAQPERVALAVNSSAVVDDGTVTVTLPPVSWSVLALG